MPKPAPYRPETGANPLGRIRINCISGHHVVSNFSNMAFNRFQDSSGTILGPFSDHSATNLGTFSDDSWYPPPILFETSRNHQLDHIATTARPPTRSQLEHDRHLNSRSHIRIAALLWDQTILPIHPSTLLAAAMQSTTRQILGAGGDMPEASR